MLQVGDRFPVEKLSVQPGGPGRRLLLSGGASRRAARWRRRRSTTATTRFRAAGYEVIGVSIDRDRQERRVPHRVRARLPARLRRGRGADERARPAEAVRRLRVVRAARHVPARRDGDRAAGLGRRGRRRASGGSARRSRRMMSVEAVRSLLRGVRAARPRRRARDDGRRHRLAPGAGPPARRHLPRARDRARERLRPARRVVVGGVRGRAGGDHRPRRRRRRPRPLHRAGEEDRRPLDVPFCPRLALPRRQGRALPPVRRHARLGRGAA